MEKHIPYGHQWVDASDIKEVVKVLKGDWLTQGPQVEEFEKAIAKYCGAKYAVAVSSGTAALHLAYMAAGLKPGDQVITTPVTFLATANMLAVLGIEPVFADIKKDTLNIDPEKIEGKITQKTKAIVTVDFAGNPCDYQKILDISKKHNLLVIEDASHAIGATYQGKKIGSFADMTIFSFHPVKIITTGEGGVVATNNKDFYQKVKILRSHGAVKKPDRGGWYYEMETPGYNYRITEIQCALGRSQLKKIGAFIQKRRSIAKKYRKAFKNTKEIQLPAESEHGQSSWHIYPIQLRRLDRRKVFEALQKEGIGVQVHYIPLHLQPFYQKKYGYKVGDFPVAEEYYRRAITLPLFPKMTNAEVKKVIKKVILYAEN